MSAADTIVPLLATPWRAGPGVRPCATPLPGLSQEAIGSLAQLYPGTLNAETCKLLRRSSGLAATALGDIDFTGTRWHPQEPLTVFKPCLSLAVDGSGRRWIAEGAGEQGLPGPVWCVFPRPPVAMYVSNDLAGFLWRLRDSEESTGALQWLRALTEAAFTVWDHRHSTATRCRKVCGWDRGIRGWLYGLPAGALVYDLRSLAEVPGWPYGVLGESARFFRCGRLPVFAVVPGLDGSDGDSFQFSVMNGAFE
jgi:hypothetical protein